MKIDRQLLGWFDTKARSAFILPILQLVIYVYSSAQVASV
jgi:hypothetical protein